MIGRLVHSKYIYLIIFAFYLIGIWGMSVPLTGDQKVYISIALEMRERAEWIIPYLFGEANFLKPPLQYWATLVGWNIFGLNLLGALIPSVLALLGSAYWVNQISKQEFKTDSYLPGLLFSASLGTMTYGTTGQMEIWIVFFYLWAWYEFLQNRLFRTFILVGIMAWVKGPLYPVLWVVSSAFYFYQRRELKRLVSKTYLLSLIVGVVIGLAWYLMAARTHLQPMLDVFLMRENMAKMQTNQGSMFGLWGEFFYTLFPWVLVVVMAISSSAVRLKLKQHRVFYFSFALFPALFFTFFPYRVNTYLYLLTPVAAWICVSVGTLEKNKVSLALSTLSTVVALALAVLAIRLTLGGWIGWEVGLPLLLVLGLWSIFHFKADLKGVALTSLLIVNLIRVGAVELGEKDLAGLRRYHETNSAPLAYLIEYKDIWHEFGLVSSALGTDVQRLYRSEEMQEFLMKGGAVILQDAQGVMATGLECTEWPRLRRRMKFPVVQLLTHGLPYGDPSVMRSYQICQKSEI